MPEHNGYQVWPYVRKAQCLLGKFLLSWTDSSNYFGSKWNISLFYTIGAHVNCGNLLSLPSLGALQAENGLSNLPFGSCNKFIYFNICGCLVWKLN